MKIPFRNGDVMCPQCLTFLKGTFTETRISRVNFCDVEMGEYEGGYLDGHIDEEKVENAEPDLHMLWCPSDTCDWSVEVITYSGDIEFVYVEEFSEQSKA